TMAQAAVAAQVHQALDRHAHLAAEVALDHEPADLGAQALDFRLGQVHDAGRRVDAGRIAHLAGTGTANAVDALQSDPDMLLGGQVDASNTRHYAVSKLVDWPDTVKFGAHPAECTRNFNRISGSQEGPVPMPGYHDIASAPVLPRGTGGGPGRAPP